MEGVIFNTRMYSDSTQTSARIAEITSDESSHFDVVAYPNPTGSMLNVMGLSSGIFTFYIYDLSGKNYLREGRNLDSNQDVGFDVSFIPNGIYLLHVVGQHGIDIIKFSKQ